MTEDESQSFKPTKKNILAQMGNLVGNVKSGDELFFMFSGHGYASPTRPSLFPPRVLE
jgi:hypothetical protein